MNEVFDLKNAMWSHHSEPNAQNYIKGNMMSELEKCKKLLEDYAVDNIDYAIMFNCVYIDEFNKLDLLRLIYWLTEIIYSKNPIGEHEENFDMQETITRGQTCIYKMVEYLKQKDD